MLEMKYLEMKYFVLKPRGTDIFAVASRHAMRAYANIISCDPASRVFADQVRTWALREEQAADMATKHSQEEEPTNG